MDQSVSTFFTKNAADGYAAQYEIDHSPRLDAMIQQWDLRTYCSGKRVVDVGGGLGFLGKRLDPSTDYWVIDGAEIKEEARLCKGMWLKADLDKYDFGDQGIITPDPSRPIEYDGLSETVRAVWIDVPRFDVCFVLETLEHLTNPYHCLAQIKKLVKPGGDIIISLPHENVTHNTIYAGLIWPYENWEQFLGQMALPIKGRWLWDKGWNARHWWCINAGWEHAQMLFPKAESKFYGKTPVEYVNL